MRGKGPLPTPPEGGKPFVLRDTNERKGWDFPAGDAFGGTLDATLPTGDYTILGFEERLCVERKASTGELSGNVYDPRFARQLQRMAAFDLAFLVLEFSLEDLAEFPRRSGIPECRWPELKNTAKSILRELTGYSALYGIHVVFAGRHGRDYTRSLFKRVLENAAKKA